MPEDTPPTPEELSRATFAEAFRGYHPGRVDQLIERAAADLAAGRPLDWLPAPGRVRRCFRGYRRADVDLLLGRLRSSAAAATPSTSPAPEPTAGTDEVGPLG
jgi:DivIVA domain-containing protein